MANDIGLVLGGGGAKGAYQAGVYKALSELGIAPQIAAFSGTSVGALNAVLFECRGTEAEEVWLGLKSTDLLHVTPGQLQLLAAGGPANAAALTLLMGLPFSQGAVSELIDKYIDFKEIKRPVYVTCLRSKLRLLAPPERKAEYFQLNQVYPWYEPDQQKDMLLASSALPLVYFGLSGARIRGFNDRFFDGGYTDDGDNLPIRPLYDSGIRKIIAVPLTMEPELEKQHCFEGAEIVNIIPTEDLGGQVAGMLYLDHDKAEHDIQLGYDDTMLLRRRLTALTEK
ncbi:MAG: patatin-like phospholipase family protein [Ruminococcus sp.]|nr:patatin-like phospholipase family protein [Ruminococcus sp.]